MNSSGVFGKILLLTIMFSLILLIVLILVFIKLPIDQAEKMGSFLSGITSVGLICISVGSIYATIYVAKSINDLSTESRRDDEYAERMIDVMQKMIVTDTLLHKAFDDERYDNYRDFEREKTIQNLMSEQKTNALILKYYLSKYPKIHNGFSGIVDSFIKNTADTTQLRRIEIAIFSLLGV